MKRTFALLLTALLAVSSTACGYNNGTVNSTTPEKSVTGSNAVTGTSSNTATGTGVTKNTSNNGTSTTTAKTAGDTMLGIDKNGVGASKSAVINKNGTNATTATTTTTTQNGTAGSVIRGATYGQMLRNARVHDKDGFLLDGENAVTPGAAYR